MDRIYLKASSILASKHTTLGQVERLIKSMEIRIRDDKESLDRQLINLSRAKAIRERLANEGGEG